MADFPSLPLFTDAIVADCYHLTDEEFGRYMRILILMWRTQGCKIPDDPHWISKRLHIDALAYAQQVQPILQEFCTVDAGHWVQKRLLKEYQYVRELTAKRKKAAEIRWKKGKKTQPTEKKWKASMQMDKQSISTADAPTPTPTPTPTSIDNTNVLSSVEIDMLFQNVWNAYPGRGKDGARGNGYKGGKKAALDAFTEIIKQTKEEDRETIIRNITEGAARYEGHLDRSGYPSKHASTWLNQRGWEDEYDSQPSRTGKPAGSKHERARSVLIDDDSTVIEG